MDKKDTVEIVYQLEETFFKMGFMSQKDYYASPFAMNLTKYWLYKGFND